MLLAKVLAAALVLFGLFGLVVVSIRDNREDMFFSAGPRWHGYLAWLHALLVFICMVACGLSVWARPTLAPALAWGIVGLLIIGKLLSLASGHKIKCLRCLVMALVLTSLTAYAISVGVG